MFCFECGCIVHGEKGCLKPRSTILDGRVEEKQWGV